MGWSNAEEEEKTWKPWSQDQVKKEEDRRGGWKSSGESRDWGGHSSGGGDWNKSWSNSKSWDQSWDKGNKNWGNDDKNWWGTGRKREVEEPRGYQDESAKREKREEDAKLEFAPTTPVPTPAPTTPAAASVGHPGTPAPVPMTPRDAFASPLPAALPAPSTPAAAFTAAAAPAGHAAAATPVSVPRTPRASLQGPGIARRVPSTPRGALQGATPGMTPSTSLIPSTPRAAFPGATPGMTPSTSLIPSTPAAAFQGMTPLGMTPRTSVAAPSTPATAFQPIPSTPRAAFTTPPYTPGAMQAPPGTPGLAPGTPAQRLTPGTPAGLPPGSQVRMLPPGTPAGPPPIGLPGTPAMPMPVPMTPGGAIPATPAGAIPGTPGQNQVPATPAGLTPGTPVPGGLAPQLQRGGGRTLGRAAGLSTPSQGGRVAPTPNVMQGPAKPQVPTFSDGSTLTLRHAPRKRKGTGERLPAPGTPASIPKHWEANSQIVPVGEKPKPKAQGVLGVGDVPDFERWRKQRKKDLPQITAVRPAPGQGVQQPGADGGMTPMPLQQPGGMTPAMPPIAAPVVKAPENDAKTPLLKQEGDATPFIPTMGEATFGTPTATTLRQVPGAETPLLPLGPFAGDETPRVGGPTPGLGTVSIRAAAGSDPGDAGSHLGAGSVSVWAPGAETPRLFTSASGASVAPYGEETPRLPAYPATAGDNTPFLAKEQSVSQWAGDVTPMLAMTPQVAGAETPLLDQGGIGGDVTPHLGSMTPPPSAVGAPRVR